MTAVEPLTNAQLFDVASAVGYWFSQDGKGGVQIHPPPDPEEDDIAGWRAYWAVKAEMYGFAYVAGGVRPLLPEAARERRLEEFLGYVSLRLMGWEFDH